MAWKAIIMRIISGLNDHRQTPFPRPHCGSEPSFAFSLCEPFPAEGPGSDTLQLKHPKVFLTAERSREVLPNSRTQFPHAMSTSTKEGLDSQVEGSE